MMIAIRSITVRVCGLLLVALLMPSCATNYGTDPQDVARTITKLRREGKREMERYLDSELVDLAALEKATGMLEKSTEVGSQACPSCYLEHATYLSMLGHHYRYLLLDLLEEAEQSESRTEVAELRAEADEYRERMVRYFRESNKSYRTYFRSSRAVDPVFYLRVAIHYQAMEEWDAALRHLEIFEEEGRNLLSIRQKRDVADLKRKLRDNSKREIELPRQREFDRRRETERRRPHDPLD
jgi:hypothetical protein